MRVGRTVLMAGAAVAAAAPAAFAQHWGHGRTPGAGACFYRDAGFHGEYFCVDAGRSVSELPHDLNDAISSVRIFGRAEVFLYRDRHFNGRSIHFEREVHDLKRENWNDTVSSVEVRWLGGHSEHSSREAERIVTRAYEDLLGRQPDPQGMRLYRSRIVDDGWSEARVREALRDSPEYRERNAMTRPKAEEIVRRAYESVLKREPDPAAAGYVNRVLRDHWTQADVERELRKSPEYRRGR